MNLTDCDWVEMPCSTFRKAVSFEERAIPAKEKLEGAREHRSGAYARASRETPPGAQEPV
jgi:hypothetical protein